LGRALVICGEGDGFSVGRKGRTRFLARMRRQTAGDTALDADTPEVALGGKDDRIAVQRRETVVPAILCQRYGREQRKMQPEQTGAHKDASSIHRMGRSSWLRSHGLARQKQRPLQAGPALRTGMEMPAHSVYSGRTFRLPSCQRPE